MPVVVDDSVDGDNDDDTVAVPTMETLSVSQNTRDNNNNNNNNSSLGSRSNSMIPHENDHHPQYRPSPTALAFFQALDQQTEQQQQASSSTSTATMTSLIQKPKASPWIQKQIQTLGWRNRYSQTDDYPLTIETTSTTTTSIKFHVRQVQRGEIDDTYGTGATVWPASMVLIKYLQRHATTKFGHYPGTSSQPRTILDLGTGTGITTIAAAVLWGSPQPQQHVHIVCTDGDPNVVSLARENVTRAATEIQAQLQNHVDPSPNHHHQIDPTTTDASDRSANRRDVGDDRKTNQTTTTTLDGLPLSSTGTDRQHHVVAAADPDEVILIRQCTIEIQQYWWGTGTIHSKVIPINNDNENEHCQNSLSHCFDMILVSDCVLPKLYPIEPLIEAIDQMLGQRRCDPKPVAVLSYEYRYYPLYDPKQYVTELCAQHQLRLEVVPASEHDPVYSVPNDIEIWHIYRV